MTVETVEATDLEDLSATLVGELTTLNVGSADVYFQWRSLGETTWNETAKQEAVQVEEFEDEITGLSDESEIQVGETTNSTVTLERIDGSTVTASNITYVDYGSSDTTVATVDDIGVIKGESEGSVTITAAYLGYSDTADVDVVNPDGGTTASLTNTRGGAVVWPSITGTTTTLVTDCPGGMAGSGTEDDPCQVTDIGELQAMTDDLSAHYALQNDIDANETQDWNGGSGFDPIGDSTSPFSGSLDGRNHTVEGLFIDRPSRSSVGLFGEADDTAAIENVAITDVTITGGSDVGALLGAGRPVIRNVAATNGTVVGEGGSNTGGLVGYGQSGDTGAIDIQNAYVSVTVDGRENTGGLVGLLEGPVENTYANGSVAGTTVVGGLAGFVDEDATISDSYAAGPVEGDSDVGGLVGDDTNLVPIGSDVVRSYWDTQTTGQDSSTGGTGLTTDEMTGMDAENNMDFDYDMVWALTDEYPILRWSVVGQTFTIDAGTTYEFRAVAETEFGDDFGEILTFDTGSN